MHADSTLPPPAQVRAGGTVLSLIASPLSVPILRAHLDGPLRLPDLRERLGGAAQTTLRGQVGNLRGIGALERHVRGGMPYTVENELTEVGRGVLAVAEIVEAWLTRAPQGPITLGSEPAKGAIRALVGGWGSTMLRALAARPLSLTELSSVIGDHSYPALERRLSAMRAARQVEPRPNGGRGAKPYGVTNWTRQAVAPLAAAGRCECEHLAEATDPLARIDIEAAFLLSVPLVDLEITRSGSCLFAVDTGIARKAKGTDRLAGVYVEIEGGGVVSCSSRLEQDPRTWAVGSIGAWVDAILEGKRDRLRLGGEDPKIADDLITRLHGSLQ
ncbi:MAG: HxlR-like helix-turn-helix [Solirubrobacterales bacterium]|jgi:DNA-binding HxlR family transcriptional regulator|nr:HxlR-like helix-turn-helix [Solirubrobacterales bacterium]